MRHHSRTEIYLFGLVFTFLLQAILFAQDSITLRSGQVIEGRVLSADGLEVVILTNGARLTFPREQVADVQRASPESLGPGERAARMASRSFQEGRPIEAWEQFVAMYRAEAGAVQRHKIIIRQTANQLVELIEERLRAEKYDQALEVLNLLKQPGNWELASEVVANPVFIERLDQKVRAYGLYEQAQQLRRQDPSNPQIITLIEQAVETYPGQEPQGLEEGPAIPDMLYRLAEVAATQGRIKLQQGNQTQARELFDRSFQALNAILNSGEADSMTMQNARNAKRALEASGIRYSKAAVPTPSPAPPTPTPYPMTPVPTPIPTPTPVPSLSERISQSWKDKDFGEMISAPFGDDGLAPSLKPILFGLGIFIGIYWILPYLILKPMEYRGDIVAAESRRRLKLLGIFTLFLYTKQRVGSIRPKAAPKNACPNCGGNLDVVELYDDFDFSRCPHCKDEIPQIHNLEEMLLSLSNQLQQDAERANIGASTMESVAKADKMQRLVSGILTLALRRRASDIHFEPQEKDLLVRQRIDGMMSEMVRLPRSLSSVAVSAIKVMASMDIAEKRKPQDGSFSTWIDGADIDIRVATSPSNKGEKATLRLLDIRTIQMTPKRLGMQPSSRQAFEKAISMPHGLVLTTGPTGSGKTTTLYVAVRSIATGEKNVISIEDPIEFKIDNINQIQVNPSAGLTFANGLRSILRQDPDVIMVGEIRDRDAAQIAVEAASTGHLVLSTLHTIDSCTAVTRLMELGIGSKRFSDSLTLVMAQRLIRLVCPECRKQVSLSRAQIEQLGLLPEEAKQFTFHDAVGCPVCHQTGFFGRTGLFEMLLPDAEIRHLIETGNFNSTELRELAIRKGMKTIRMEGISLYKKGMTTFEELQRVTR